MELSQEDAGHTRRVRVGENVTIVLPESPTTGYRWEADVDADVLPLVSDEYDGGAHPVGAGGTRRLTFAPARPGPATLHLVKRRAWEGAAVGEFAVTLDVTPG